MNLAKRFMAAILRFFEHKRIHAFQVYFDGHLYYVCARCSGLYLGVGFGFPLVMFLQFVVPTAFTIGDLATDLLCLGLALPTILDWTTQRLALRKSTNPIRFTTALLAGIAFAWYLIAPVNFLHKLLFLFVILFVISIFSFIDRRSPIPIETSGEEEEVFEVKLTS